jgi:hypothetical protein
MQRGPSVLKVYETGSTIVVGFEPDIDLLEDDITESHSGLLKLMQAHNAQSLTFDLTNLVEVPRPLLNMMYSFAKHGTEVQLFNPTPSIRKLLETTKLSSILREVDTLYRESA